MIISECYGGGHRWYCTNCDQGHNGYVSTITWTNSTPPRVCSRCAEKLPPITVALAADMHLRSIYGERYVTPGSNKLIAELIKQHQLTKGHNAHRLAAIINQS